MHVIRVFKKCNICIFIFGISHVAGLFSSDWNHWYEWHVTRLGLYSDYGTIITHAGDSGVTIVIMIHLKKLVAPSGVD